MVRLEPQFALTCRGHLRQQLFSPSLLLSPTLLLNNFPVKVSPVLTGLSLMSGTKHLFSMGTAKPSFTIFSSSKILVLYIEILTQPEPLCHSWCSERFIFYSQTLVGTGWSCACPWAERDPLQQHHLLMPMQCLSSPSNQNKITGIFIWA